MPKTDAPQMAVPPTRACRVFPLSWYFNTTHSNFATSQHHYHTNRTISLPPPTQPAVTMADDDSAGKGSSSKSRNNNSSSNNHLLPDGDQLRLFRRLEAELDREQKAERKRRSDELVEKAKAANTLEAMAAMFDSINADADLHFPGVRPRELDDPRWPTLQEIWAAAANTPPPATLADVLALRQQATAPAPNAEPTTAPTVAASIERDVPVTSVRRRVPVLITTQASPSPSPSPPPVVDPSTLQPLPDRVGAQRRPGKRRASAQASRSPPPVVDPGTPQPRPGYVGGIQRRKAAPRSKQPASRPPPPVVDPGTPQPRPGYVGGIQRRKAAPRSKK
jgi:hypothetical protein